MIDQMKEKMNDHNKKERKLPNERPNERKKKENYQMIDQMKERK